jgi:hypothetical protein
MKYTYIRLEYKINLFLEGSKKNLVYFYLLHPTHHVFYKSSHFEK